MRFLTIRHALVAALLLSLSPGLTYAQGVRDPYYDFLMARRLEKAGDAAAALAALERAAAADPKSSEIRAEIASFELTQNHSEQAEQAARAALMLDDNNVEAHRVLGLIYFGYLEAATPRTPAAQADEYAKQAIAHLERAVADPAGATDITLHYQLGRLYLRNGDADKAIQAFVRVVNQNPNSVQARLSLAQAFATAKDLNSAIEALADIVDDEPRVAAPLAQYQEQAGQLKEAVETYTKALSVTPMSRELKFRRLAVLFTLQDYKQAAVFAAEAQMQHPDDLRFVQLQARALFETGDRGKAVDTLESAVRAHPADMQTQFALVGLYKDGGRGQDAVARLRLMLMAEPQNADVLNYLGYLLADRGQDLEEAIGFIKRALDLEPGNPSFLDSLGWAHFRMGNMAEAEKNLAPAAQQLPRNSVIQAHLGDVFARSGRWNEAIVAWTRALDGDGQDIDRAEIQKKIADARTKTGR